MLETICYVVVGVTVAWIAFEALLKFRNFIDSLESIVIRED